MHATEAAAKAALDALTAIEAAVKAVSAEADRTKDPEMAATVEALRGLDLHSERSWVAERGKTEADEDGDSPFSVAGYPAYLLVTLRRLRTIPMHFSVVLGRKAEEHRLCLHRITAPMALGHRLIQETGIHLMTFGTAIADEDRPRTILLTIEGRQLPGIKKKLERMLRLHRPLPFQHVALFAGGAEVEDIDDEDDHDIELPFDADPMDMEGAELRAEILRIRPRLSAAMLESAEKRTIIMSETERFVARLKAGDLVGARAGIVSLHALIPGETFSDATPVPRDPAG